MRIGEILALTKEDIDLDEKIGVLQENDFLCIFELPENDTIQEEYLKQVK